MEVVLQKENDDGSSDYFVNLSEEEQAQLIRFAFIEMLKRGIKEGMQYDPNTGELSVGDTEGGAASGSDGTGIEPIKPKQS
jgi:hypothetical protein